MMFASEISKEDLQALPLLCFKGKIHLITTPEAADSAANELSKSPVIGFDTETRPSFTKGKVNKVALLQLATRKHAYLVRLCRMTLSPGLVALFSDPNIVKVGAAIRNDLSTLGRNTALKPQALIDLQDMMRQWGITNLSLTKMSGIILGARVAKAQQLSNWENETLTEAQQRYAATDAWACYMIYHKLMRVKQTGI